MDDHCCSDFSNASRFGHKDCIRNLLDYFGEDVNSTDHCGYTPLHCVVKDCHYDYISMLLERGADINKKDNRGWTPLHYASDNNCSRRIRSGAYECFKILLQNGANINEKDNEGWTCLHYASFYGYEDFMLTLLNIDNIHIDEKNNDGWTPLHLAVDVRKHNCVQTLLCLGADINVKDNIGWTPLHHASDHGCEICIIILLDNGAIIDQKDDSGRTILDVADSKTKRFISEYFEIQIKEPHENSS